MGVGPQESCWHHSLVFSHHFCQVHHTLTNLQTELVFSTVWTLKCVQIAIKATLITLKIRNTKNSCTTSSTQATKSCDCSHVCKKQRHTQNTQNTHITSDTHATKGSNWSHEHRRLKNTQNTKKKTAYTTYQSNNKNYVLLFFLHATTTKMLQSKWQIQTKGRRHTQNTVIHTHNKAQKTTMHVYLLGEWDEACH